MASAWTGTVSRWVGALSLYVEMDTGPWAGSVMPVWCLGHVYAAGTPTPLLVVRSGRYAAGQWLAVGGACSGSAVGLDAAGRVVSTVVRTSDGSTLADTMVTGGLAVPFTGPQNRSGGNAAPLTILGTGGVACYTTSLPAGMPDLVTVGIFGLTGAAASLNGYLTLKWNPISGGTPGSYIPLVFGHDWDLHCTGTGWELEAVVSPVGSIYWEFPGGDTASPVGAYGPQSGGPTGLAGSFAYVWASPQTGRTA